MNRTSPLIRLFVRGTFGLTRPDQAEVTCTQHLSTTLSQLRPRRSMFWNVEQVS